MRKGGRATGTGGPDGKNIIKTGGRFTNTAVPRFKGGSSWQQHLQIFQAIMKSNGWTDGTAALQLFAHLDGEALNVAILMPEGERSNWEGLSQGLSDYYNSLGRLAVFRRQFESAARRPGMDLATFATELENPSSARIRGHGPSAVQEVGSAERGQSVLERAVFAGGHLFSVLVTRLVGGCPGWPVSGETNWWN